VTFIGKANGRTIAVDFINILRSHFLYKFFAKEKTLLEKAAKKDFRTKKQKNVDKINT